jgi:hypothetical protein
LRVLDYGLLSTKLSTKELDRFLEWLTAAFMIGTTELRSKPRSFGTSVGCQLARFGSRWLGCRLYPAVDGVNSES